MIAWHDQRSPKRAGDVSMTPYGVCVASFQRIGSWQCRSERAPLDLSR